MQITNADTFFGSDSPDFEELDLDLRVTILKHFYVAHMHLFFLTRT